MKGFRLVPVLTVFEGFRIFVFFHPKGDPYPEKLENFKTFKHSQKWYQSKALHKFFLKKQVFTLIYSLKTVFQDKKPLQSS